LNFRNIPLWCFISHELVDALSLYHTLMRDMPPAYSAVMPPPYSAYMPPPSALVSHAPTAAGGMPYMAPPPGYAMTSPGQPAVNGMMMMQPGSSAAVGGGAGLMVAGVMPPVSNGVTGPASYPMYYMDPSMYPGSAPPPTPPLQDAAAMNLGVHQADYMGQHQQQQAVNHVMGQQQPIYSQHTP
jgi:hypothetical protein